MRKWRHLLIILALSIIISCDDPDNTAPRVVSTSPSNMSKNVDPALPSISVTFNEQMMDQSWSWAYADQSKFPSITGQAYYTDNKLVNILPVKLEPNKHYEIWVNTKQHQNFKDTSGNAAVPFKFTFMTR